MIKNVFVLEEIERLKYEYGDLEPIDYELEYILKKHVRHKIRKTLKEYNDIRKILRDLEFKVELGSRLSRLKII